MKELIFYFFIGMIATGVPATAGALIANKPDTAAIKTNTPSPTPFKELSQTPSQIPSHSPSPTADKTKPPSPQPTLTASPKITPSPELTPNTPQPTPDVWPPADLLPLFEKYAIQYNADQNLLEYIANCESHFNPNAVNGPYLGMFQFGVGAWQKYRALIGEDINPDLRTNSEESIQTAAYITANYGSGFWPSCSF